jgi:hypothetical protein
MGLQEKYHQNVIYTPVSEQKQAMRQELVLENSFVYMQQYRNHRLSTVKLSLLSDVLYAVRAKMLEAGGVK